MHRINERQLPAFGISRQFLGADQGDVAISAFIVSAPQGRGPVLHRHPYDTVAFVREGKGRWTVGDRELEAGPGDILVVKAGEVHKFLSLGPDLLVLIDIHLGPRFVQENLE
jgi:mannose-6-phosphate isomerase-like protein (cupin superfamily)